PDAGDAQDQHLEARARGGHSARLTRSCAGPANGSAQARGWASRTNPTLGQVSSWLSVRSWRYDMAVVYALVLAAVGALFVYLALQVEGGFSLTSLNLAAYYVTVAFIAFVNMILFAAAVFAKD